MDRGNRRARPHRRTAVVISTWSAAEDDTAATGEGEVGKLDDPLLDLSKPAGWVVSAITSKAELASSVLLFLSSPLLNLFFEARAVPSRVAHTSVSTLRRLARAVLAAVCTVAILIVVMVVSFLVGFSVVGLLVEEPVVLHQPLYFDYTLPQPVASAQLKGAGSRGRALPAGHKVIVTLKLLTPESNFNLQVGIFQVSTEAISSTGRVIAAFSQPCMLRFKSLPVRLMKTFAMALPLLIGVQTETQQLVLEVLRYKEESRRTEAIKVRLTPRAGTLDLPQIYHAEVVLHTQLPRRKEVVYNWKWTLCVWVSLYVYVLLLIVVFCCFKPLDFWRQRPGLVRAEQVVAEATQGRGHGCLGDVKVSEEFTEAVRRWREMERRRRMGQVAQRELVEGSASSTAGETSEVIEDYGECEASEGLC